MSKRFLRWAEAWIEQHVPAGANPDVESHAARAKRLSERLFAEAIDAGFTNVEAEEARTSVAPLMLAAVSDDTEFDLDAYRLKLELARENEDGD